MAELFEIPFELWTCVDPTNHVLDHLDDVQMPPWEEMLLGVSGPLTSIVKYTIWGEVR